MNDPYERIASIHPHRIAVLTGAGISADSGIPTFRGAGGLWRNFRAEDLATPEAFTRDAKTVWEWYEWRREIIRNASPNAAHLAIARLEQVMPTTVITQNVDGLHARGGSREPLELHGSIIRVRCVAEGIRHDAVEPFAALPPLCSCGALLRPDVVWFGEPLDSSVWTAAVEAVQAADLVLVVGTSSIVYPAAGLVGFMRGVVVEINPEATPLTGTSDITIAATAAEAVPLVVEALTGGRR